MTPSNQRVVVVGAGPAGLAIAGALKVNGISPIVLEASDAVGQSWRNHYERLHLHTARDHSALPGLPFPAHFPTYPSRLQVVEYLELYARHFAIEPQFGTQVSEIREESGHWRIRWKAGTTVASAVVITTGFNRVPFVPRWIGQDDFMGKILHSSEYRNGSADRGKHVLVVGAGNSGAEIALDLLEHGAKPHLCIRNPINVVPRDLFGIPMQSIGVRTENRPLWFKDFVGRVVSRLSFGNLEPWGIRRSTRGPASQIMFDKTIPMIDVGTIAAIKRGAILVRPGIEAFSATGATFVDGQSHPYDAVILATGYRTGLGELLGNMPGVLDEHGRPIRVGANPTVPGLYFVGFRNPLTGFLRAIGIDAQAVANELAGGPLDAARKIAAAG